MHSDWRSADGNAGAGYGVSFRAGGQLPAKIETKQDLPAQELEESFGEAFAMAAEDAEFREDEEPAALMETGRALVRRYMVDAAPWVQPQAVELPVEGVIVGVRVQGIVDLLDMEGRTVDCNTAARRPARSVPAGIAGTGANASGNSADESMKARGQFGLYI